MLLVVMEWNVPLIFLMLTICMLLISMVKLKEVLMVQFFNRVILQLIFQVDNQQVLGLLHI